MQHASSGPEKNCVRRALRATGNDDVLSTSWRAISRPVVDCASAQRCEVFLTEFLTRLGTTIEPCRAGLSILPPATMSPLSATFSAPSWQRWLTFLGVVAAPLLCVSKRCRASEASASVPTSPPASSDPPPPVASAPTASAAPASVEPSATANSRMLTGGAPTSVEPPFRIDPITDGAIIGIAAGFAGMHEAILSTGELKPQRPGDPKNLLAIDRGAVRQKFDDDAGAHSNVILYGAFAFAALDPFLSGMRSGKDAALADGLLYAESLSMTWAFTGLTKIAVRRPRPRAYKEQERLDAEFGAGSPDITETDSSLSFFSGHAAAVASVSATATYLAFVRSPRTARPWITLAAGAVLTAGVGIERVRAGEHFPTDVIAGTMAGIGVGLLVPHLHHNDATGRSIRLGAGAPNATTGLSLMGAF